MMTWNRVHFLALTLSIASSCTVEDAGEATCVPGSTRSCLCTPTESGVQVCAESGRALSPCECSEDTVGGVDVPGGDVLGVGFDDAAGDAAKIEDAAAPDETDAESGAQDSVTGVDLAETPDTTEGPGLDVSDVVPCSERTSSEKQCKDCCDCEPQLDCAGRVACRDECVTFDAAHWAALADAPLFTAPSELGPTGDYGVCLSEATEASCKSCCECGDLFACGDYRHCRTACVKAFAAGVPNPLDGAIVTTGSVPAEVTDPKSCTPLEDVYRPGSTGTVVGSGQSFVVPAPFSTAPTCPNRYDPCGAGLAPLPPESEVIVIDDGPQAETFTATIYADNDFVLSVGGVTVCRDALHFTPFNSHVVQFRVTLPTVLAIEVVDAEEALGVGVEKGTAVGDGGLVARVVDAKGGTVLTTSSAWRCQVVYAAPFDDTACVKAGRDTSACPSKPLCPSDAAYGDCHALHWAVPPAWTAVGFDDGAWPAAVEYSADVVGPKTAYTSVSSDFGTAAFIWTRNLVLDNRILCRASIVEP